jgi:hypothetical protein
MNCNIKIDLKNIYKLLIGEKLTNWESLNNYLIKRLEVMSDDINYNNRLVLFSAFQSAFRDLVSFSNIENFKQAKNPDGSAFYTDPEANTAFQNITKAKSETKNYLDYFLPLYNKIDSDNRAVIQLGDYTAVLSLINKLKEDTQTIPQEYIDRYMVVNYDKDKKIELEKWEKEITDLTTNLSNMPSSFSTREELDNYEKSIKDKREKLGDLLSPDIKKVFQTVPHLKELIESAEKIQYDITKSIKAANLSLAGMEKIKIAESALQANNLLLSQLSAANEKLQTENHFLREKNILLENTIADLREMIALRKGEK